MIHPLKYTLFAVLVLIISACASSSGEFQGFSYDPAGSTVTTDKEITPQHKRTIGIMESGVWLSNEHAGARMNDFYRVNDTLYQVLIRPENSPINNSPWYSFKVWSDSPKTIWLQLGYENGDHRYYPEVSRDGKNWGELDPDSYRTDSTGTALIRLRLSQEPVWLSAQELITSEEYEWWAANLAEYPFVTRDTIGLSHEKRPIEKLTITQANTDRERGVVIVTARLHPPEITGQIAAMAFLERITDESELATLFRNQFEVIAFPFANPDGADNGHWRHNAGGVDLNRDWEAFNQPETRAIRNHLLAHVRNNPLMRVHYGIDFHSTDENIFYPINRDIDTFPEDFSYGLIDSLIASFPETGFAVEPFDTSSPITKNWIYKTFGADALTYEVDDRADRQKIRAVARKAADVMMMKLLDE